MGFAGYDSADPDTLITQLLVQGYDAFVALAAFSPSITSIFLNAFNSPGIPSSAEVMGDLISYTKGLAGDAWSTLVNNLWAAL